MKVILTIMATVVAILLNGCGVGDLVAAPFRVTGAVVNIVTPDIVGDSISSVGEAADMAIPF
jgi:hypothetical protein